MLSTYYITFNHILCFIGGHWIVFYIYGFQPKYTCVSLSGNAKWHENVLTLR